MFVWAIVGLTLYLHVIIGLCWATKCSFSPLTPARWDSTGSGNSRRLTLAHTQLWELPRISFWNGRCQLDSWDWHRISLAHVARCWMQGCICYAKLKLDPLQPTQSCVWGCVLHTVNITLVIFTVNRHEIVCTSVGCICVLPENLQCLSVHLHDHLCLLHCSVL